MVKGSYSCQEVSVRQWSKFILPHGDLEHLQKWPFNLFSPSLQLHDAALFYKGHLSLLFCLIDQFRLLNSVPRTGRLALLHNCFDNSSEQS